MELQKPGDLLVVAQLVDSSATAGQRRAAAEQWQPVLEDIGFQPFNQRGAYAPKSVWLLTDWSVLHAAYDRLRTQLGYAKSPFGD